MNLLQLGDASHIPAEDEVLRQMIEVEEIKREHFTVVVIQGISKDHLQYLKDGISEWTRQLSYVCLDCFIGCKDLCDNA
jgi:hypothetical protein